MGLESPHLALQSPFWADQVVKDVFGHVGVHRGQRIIQQIDISITVQSSSQAHPLSLTTRQIDALQDKNQIKRPRLNLYQSSSNQKPDYISNEYPINSGEIFDESHQQVLRENWK